MSQEPTPPSVSPAPPPRRSPLVAGTALIVLLVLLVAFGAVVLNRPPRPALAPTTAPTGVAADSPTVAPPGQTAAPTDLVPSAAPSTSAMVSSTVTLPAGDIASPSAVAMASSTVTLPAPGTLVAAGTETPPVAMTGTVDLGTGTPVAAMTATVGLATGTPLAVMTDTVGVGTGTAIAVMPGTMSVGTGTPLAVMTGTVGTGTGTPLAVMTDTVGTGTGTPVADVPAPPQVLDSAGTAYLCPQGPSCTVAAAPNAPLPVGGEARTTGSSTLRLQTAAGLLTLAGDSAVRLARLNAGGTGLTLTQGRVLL
ncbi:MAG: hypothetical protein M3Z04_09215, partial [Chloroflexota bacterium]|nr:hypothetical protein [Chloroflexota bacterium]